MDDSKVKIKFTLMDGAKAPSKAHATDTGYDLYVHHVEVTDQAPALPATSIRHTLVTIGTGVCCAPADGYALELRPKSRFCNTGYTMPNSPGTVDHDYRGELTLKFRVPYLAGDNTYSLHEYIRQQWKPGTPCAQLVVTRLVDSEMEQVEELSTTERGDGGFGSTAGMGH